MLVEIHMLQNHAPCNLNRDDTGSPKDCIFGGVRRSRISSQSIKRSIRLSEIFQEEMKGTDLAIRTRRMPELVKKQLISEGIDEKQAEVAAKKIAQFGKSDKKEKKSKDVKDKEDKNNDGEKTAQIMFLTHKDIDAVASVMKEAIQKGTLTNDSPDELQKKAIDRGLRPITPDIALFGRMITSDMFRDVEASMQVAHAISTNKMDHEFDYFTAVDDLQDGSQDEGPGAGMIGDVEFNSACYYKYFSMDFDGLVENLAGMQPAEKAGTEEKEKYKKSLEAAREVAHQTLRAFVKAAVYTTPTGKQNTFAAHQPPSAILVEVRPKKTPISYANAFVEPSRPNGKADLVKDSMQKFSAYVETLTRKFNLASTKRLWFSTLDDVKISGAETCDTIDDMIMSLDKAL
jgi:CRISPR system Cascade subunit CasC